MRVKLLSSSYSIPKRLQAHRDGAVKLFKALGKIRKGNNGDWENNQSARICDADFQNKIITISRAMYFDQVGTNLTSDWASGLLGGDELNTLRQVEPPQNGELCNLRDSILANTLGVAAVVVDRNKDMLIRIRGSEQAVMNAQGGRFHCSVSGVFELDESLSHGNLDFSEFSKGMTAEIRTELNIDQNEYDLFPVAFSRELVRQGKPQLFFVIKTELTFDEIENRARNAEEAWEFIDPTDIPESNPLFPYLASPGDAPTELFSFEGSMALAIVSSYLDGTIGPFRL